MRKIDFKTKARNKHLQEKHGLLASSPMEVNVPISIIKASSSYIFECLVHLSVL